MDDVPIAEKRAAEILWAGRVLYSSFSLCLLSSLHFMIPTPVSLTALILLPLLSGDALHYGHAAETGFSDGRQETREQGKLMAPA